jgi:hypothetical protein
MQSGYPPECQTFNINIARALIALNGWYLTSLCILGAT